MWFQAFVLKGKNSCRVLYSIHRVIAQQVAENKIYFIMIYYKQYSTSAYPYRHHAVVVSVILFLNWYMFSWQMKTLKERKIKQTWYCIQRSLITVENVKKRSLVRLNDVMPINVFTKLVSINTHFDSVKSQFKQYKWITALSEKTIEKVNKRPRLWK